MVKFGRHLQFFLDNEHQGSDLYVVPYNDVRLFIASDNDDFGQQWQAALELASADFLRATTAWWNTVFAGIQHLNESRGALPEVALRLYMSVADEEELSELLSRTKQLHSTALTNAEALRKLVKKYDKEHEQHRVSHDYEKLSPILLPQVYAANFTVGQSTLEAALAVLRTQLDMDDDEHAPAAVPAELQEVGAAVAASSLDKDQQELLHDGADNATSDDNNNPASTTTQICLTCNETPASYLAARRHTNRHDDAVELRKAELEWLNKLLASIPQSELSHIVAHRGFHNPLGRSDKRPLENSLSAYETAWTNGIHLCECDIALTKDEKLVLAHDEDFSRLALDPKKPSSNVKVRDLTFRQLLALPLKSGTRPPLLLDVLQSAKEIGGGSQLIIEIKPGNSDAATALARLFLKHPELMSSCAVVMSFDAFAMHNLRREMVTVLDSLQQQDQQRGSSSRLSKTMSIPTSMSFGNFSVAHNLNTLGTSPPPSHPTMTTTTSSTRAIPIADSSLQQGTHGRIDSSDNVGMWLSESVNTRNDSFQNFGTFAQPSNGTVLPASSSSSTTTMMTRRKPSIDKYPSTSTTSPGGSSSNSLKRRPSMDRSRGSLVSQGGAPKLMLLTVADPPKIPTELWVDVDDLSPVDGWLHAHDGSLDGVYLQFQPKMMKADGARHLRALAKKCCCVGVWGHNGRDPDDWETFHWLVKECQVSYVNSDFPKGFKRGLRSSTLTSA